MWSNQPKWLKTPVFSALKRRYILIMCEILQGNLNFEVCSVIQIPLWLAGTTAGTNPPQFFWIISKSWQYCSEYQVQWVTQNTTLVSLSSMTPAIWKYFLKDNLCNSIFLPNGVTEVKCCLKSGKNVEPLFTPPALFLLANTQEETEKQASGRKTRITHWVNQNFGLFLFLTAGEKCWQPAFIPKPTPGNV